jgi:Tol biopolymer transport system component
MAGIRIGGTAVIVVCSPPFTAFDGPGGFADDNPQVYVACTNNAPGEATRYTDFSGFTDSDDNYNPVLSPDGSKVLFEVLSASTGFREIWVVDTIAGSTPTQLVANGSQYCFHPFWGPDSDTFVYLLGTGGGVAENDVYKDQVSAIGSPTLLKTHAAGVGGAFRPQFNFDGTRVAYLWTGAAGYPQLRCMDDDGTNDGLVANNLIAYDSNEPPQYCWANTQNLLAYEDGDTAAKVYVIDDTGAGSVQVNANGDAAGAACNISGKAWPANDSFLVISANLGAGFYNVIRCELDGSDTNVLGTTGPTLLSYFRGPLVFEGRIWFISDYDAIGGKGEISFMSLTGGTETLVFDSSAGAGDVIQPFVGGGGWYFN